MRLHYNTFQVTPPCVRGRFLDVDWILNACRSEEPQFECDFFWRYVMIARREDQSCCTKRVNFPSRSKPRPRSARTHYKKASERTKEERKRGKIARPYRKRTSLFVKLGRWSTSKINRKVITTSAQYPRPRTRPDTMPTLHRSFLSFLRFFVCQRSA